MKFVSDRCIQVLQDNNITGWSHYPVRLFTKDGEPIAGFSGFSITGRIGAVDITKSTVVKMMGDVEYYKGIYFDMSTWDGSDFFLSVSPEWSPLYMFASERVKHLVESEKLTNIQFMPNNEFEFTI